MYDYSVISERTGVPVMDDLGAAVVEEGASSRDAGRITFANGYTMNPVPYDPAVGVRCEVVRTDGEQTQERGGAVYRVTPNVIVDFDGGGWH